MVSKRVSTCTPLRAKKKEIASIPNAKIGTQTQFYIWNKSIFLPFINNRNTFYKSI
jgi:hypothetical protein